MGTLTVGKLVLTNTTSNQDAYDRLRVSNPVTVYENLSVGAGAKNPLLIDELIDSPATSVANANSYIAMTVTNTGGRVVRQSKPYVVYKPGTSKLTFCTGVFNTDGGRVGVRSRIGFFDDENDQVTNPQGGDGYFFELDGTTMGIVYRTASSGSEVDTRVVQSSWNTDTFDGNGPSGITITTWDDAFLLVFDQQWLGVGQVRIGLLIEGIIHFAQIFTNAGLKLPYTRTAKLPIRYEIENVSAGAGTDEMRMMCQSVLLEATPSSIYPQFNFENVELVGSIPESPISLRLKSTFNRVTLRIVDITLWTRTADQYACFGVYLNPTVDSSVWVSVDPNSAAEVDTAGDDPVGGTLLATGLAVDQGVTHIPLTAGGNRSPWFDINSDIEGTSDIITLVAVRIVGTPTVNISISWIEIS